MLAVPNDSPVRTLRDLEGKRIATEAVGLTRRFLEREGVSARLEFSWGATEVKVPDLVDAIVDITETGSSLRANNLRVVATLMESYPQLIANRTAWENPWKRQKLQGIDDPAPGRAGRARQGRAQDEHLEKRVAKPA